MRVLPLTLSLSLVSVLAEAETITWSGQGEVSEITGNAFGTLAENGGTVSIEVSYSSEANELPVNFLQFPAGSRNGSTRFVGDINLMVNIRIGDSEWTGTLPTASASSEALFSDCWDSVANPTANLPDIFEVNLSTAADASFPSFPLVTEESVMAMNLEFRDETTPSDLFTIQTLPDSLTKVSSMTSADGQIVAGSSRVSFTIDPDTVTIREPQESITLRRNEEGYELAWLGESGKGYRIDTSSNLRDWTRSANRIGADEEITIAVTPDESGTPRFYRVVVFE
ncbi:MAG: hypothetical protein Q7Q71_10810 [Verrucomicrobiota bacterium JB023]|nr:hypothetical protein [Verrucomicrobiota bacterium JB023]